MTDMIALFDYMLLDDQSRHTIQRRTDEIKGLVKRIAQSTVQIGGKLIEVKTLLPHGQFGEWLQMEFDWSQDTAERFMNVARWAEQNPQIAEFGFGQSALYELAKPSTPDAARQEAIERAEAGEIISHAKAKAIVTAHKQSETESFSIRSQPTAREPITSRPEEIQSTHSSFGAWIDRIYNEVLTFQNRGAAHALASPLTVAQRQKLSAIIEFLQSVAFFHADAALQEGDDWMGHFAQRIPQESGNGDD